MDNELRLARKLARDAGSILLDYYRSKPAVEWKGRNDPVTAADRAASRFLVAKLRDAFPEDGVLSEEAPDDAGRLGRRRVWIIDPMDGTKEFIARLDEFSVMIGLAVEGTPALGVVFQPATGTLYFAGSGRGGFVDRRGSRTRLRVSRETDPPRMRIAVSRSHHSEAVDHVRRSLGIADTIPSGSLGLKTGLIAEGKAHVYINPSRHTFEWDTCAPEAILREAGGRMTDLHGHPLGYNRADLANRTGVIASSGVVHDRVLAEIRKAGIEAGS